MLILQLRTFIDVFHHIYWHLQACKANCAFENVDQKLVWLKVSTTFSNKKTKWMGPLGMTWMLIVKRNLPDRKCLIASIRSPSREQATVGPSVSVSPSMSSTSIINFRSSQFLTLLKVSNLLSLWTWYVENCLENKLARGGRGTHLSKKKIHLVGLT